MESKDNQPAVSENPFFDELPQPTEASPIKVLFTLGLCVLGGYFLVSAAVLGGGTAIFGYDLLTLQRILSGDVGVEHGNFLRFALASQHIFLFILPALLCLWLTYRQGISKALALNVHASPRAIFSSITLIIAALGLVQYSYQINRALPLPAWMLDSEKNVEKTIETIFALKGFGGALLNVLLVAAMPAISEELLFRGVLQRQLGRIFKNEHLHVWLTAIVFSAIHFQFQGFLPRLILGALLGYTLVWTRSLWVPIATHFFYNGSQVMGLYAMNLQPEEMKKLEEGNNIHWTIAGISLMLTLMIGKYMRENLSKEQNV